MSFEELYREGEPPWEIGRPQPALVRLTLAGEVKGSVLDLGCGTGFNSIYLAQMGHEVTAVDFSPTALERARANAASHKVQVDFIQNDLRDLDLGRTFDTLVDSAVFHVFQDEDRAPYAASVARAARPGSRLLLMCFSEHEPEGWGGPRRVTQEEIATTFGPYFEIDWVREDSYEITLNDGSARSWVARLTRRGEEET